MSSRSTRKRARPRGSPSSQGPQTPSSGGLREPDTDLSGRMDEEEGEGEELVAQNVSDALAGDYRRIDELDEYDARDLDDREYAPISMAARQAAEVALATREEAEQRRFDRMPAALRDMSDDEDDEAQEPGAKRRRRRMAEAAALGDGAEVDVAGLETAEVSQEMLTNIAHVISEERVRMEVKRRFKHFLLHTVDDATGKPLYRARIAAMCAANESSLTVQYPHLERVDNLWGLWLQDLPGEVLELISEATYEVVLSMFPDYHQIQPEVTVRISQWPVTDSLRELRHVHLNGMVLTYGVITRRTGVFPQLKLVKFNCAKCGFVIGPFRQTSEEEMKPTSCPECQSTGPFSVNMEQTVYRNFQKITLQESPTEVPPGRVPRQKEVILTGDLVDRARPGEEVVVTGVYKHQFDPHLNSRQGFPVFSTLIEANNVERKSDVLATHMLTEEDKRLFMEMRKDRDLPAKVVRSMAPSIYGHAHVKTAIALALFGGREKNVKNKHHIRGDINVLLLGDPGTAKSQALKYVEKTAPRAVYTTGKGASAVGLTASVHRDPVTREWTLEGGALVLADRGVCLIDEFDKMNDQDRTSIHEAMEQQSISISKAGIVTTLQARCSVIAAANPIGGRYDPTKTLAENVELTDPILQRFDVLCVLQDQVDPLDDERLAAFVTTNHIKSHPAFYAGALPPLAVPVSMRHERTDEADAGVAELTPTTAAAVGSGAGGSTLGLLSDSGRGGAEEGDESKGDPGTSERDAALLERPHVAQAALDAVARSVGAEGEVIPQDVLKKLIIYARKHVHPRLSSINKDKVAQLYAELRQESISSGGVPVAVRHVESIMRMAEAHARMALRDEVTDEDLNAAIRVMLESFVQAQKFSVMQRMRRRFRRYLQEAGENNELVLQALQHLMRETLTLLRRRNPDKRSTSVQVDVAMLQQRVADYGITNINPFLRSQLFRQQGFEYEPAAGTITSYM